jgi:long-chain acyl-CoA synthetase
VARGERIALILPNCPQFVVAELSAWSIGAAIAPLNPAYPEDELATLLKRSGAGAAVVMSPFYDRSFTGRRGGQAGREAPPGFLRT